MLDGARGGEAQRPGVERLLEQLAHAGDLAVAGRRAVIGAALSHHVEAQRGVRHLGADVHDLGRCVEHVEILGEGFPIELDAFGQHGAGYVLDALHEVDQVGRGAWADRRKTDAAVAEDRRRHAMAGGGREIGVPGRLAVVVGVNVHEAGCDQQPVGIDFTAARADVGADRCDDLAVDCDVCDAFWGTIAVDYGAVADDQVVHDRKFAGVDGNRIGDAVAYYVRSFCTLPILGGCRAQPAGAQRAYCGGPDYWLQHARRGRMLGGDALATQVLPPPRHQPTKRSLSRLRERVG